MRPGVAIASNVIPKARQYRRERTSGFLESVNVPWVRITARTIQKE
jgi:hypothetical protein